MTRATEQFAALHARLARCDAQIAAHARNSPAARRAGELLGVGPVTSSALVAMVPDARVFKSGRQFAAWLGLTPRQHSSGGKTRLGRVSLRGNVYLRTLRSGCPQHAAGSYQHGACTNHAIAALDH